jgi:hypothetical protein
MRDIAVGLLLVLAFGLGFALGWTPVEQCPEDAVLVGQGEFENGRWDRYVCGPAVDDFGWAP